MASQALKTQILDNAKFLFGAKKTFEVVTGLAFIGQYGNRDGSQAVLVEINEEDGTFKTHFVGRPQEELDMALEHLHIEVRKQVYAKLSEGMEENTQLEFGPTVIEGSLGWE
ncbi:uncharacterized protein DNG_07174 [Cephalotrichum gorgonifer]|uniref:Uncharacterized protein n=1 Tax=Cephalotrichum gorgonifer TaxID=2041049 RepID=A0AAE8N2U9_9PEZI|nr:uncharacterized protein DNG_07174 [Cephalotrichum gorgonifer]